MKKQRILIIAFLISLSICALASMQAKAQTSTITSVSLSSSPIDLGQSVTITATVNASAATGNATFGFSTDSGASWSTLGSSPISAGNATFPYTPAAIGSTYEFNATYNGDQNYLNSTSSTPASLTVDSAPSISLEPSSATIDSSQSVTLTSTVTGGTGSFSWQWYDYIGPISGASGTGITATCAFLAADTGIYVIFTDTGTGSATPTATAASSPTVAVTVNSALVAPSVTPTPGVIDEGQTSSLTSTAVSTGTSPYTYQWFEMAPGGSYVSVGSNSASFNFASSVSTATGSWGFILQVTDDTGAAVNSTAVLVTVDSALTVSVAPVGPVTLDVGQSQTFTASASGGSGTLAYQWYLNGSSVGVDSDTYVFSEAAGLYSVTCTVTDSASMPASAVSNAVSVTVNQLTIMVTQTADGVVSPGTITVNYGGNQTFTITPTAGCYIASITVDDNPVAVTTPSGQTVSFTNVTVTSTLSVTFASTPTTTPTPSPSPTVTPVPISTPLTTATPAQISTSFPTSTPFSIKPLASEPSFELVLIVVTTAAEIIIILTVIAVVRIRRKT
jgi:hypothetical protein